METRKPKFTRCAVAPEPTSARTDYLLAGRERLFRNEAAPVSLEVPVEVAVVVAAARSFDVDVVDVGDGSAPEAHLRAGVGGAGSRRGRDVQRAARQRRAVLERARQAGGRGAARGHERAGAGGIAACSARSRPPPMRGRPPAGRCIRSFSLCLAVSAGQATRDRTGPPAPAPPPGRDRRGQTIPRKRVRAPIRGPPFGDPYTALPASNALDWRKLSLWCEPGY